MPNLSDETNIIKPILSVPHVQPDHINRRFQANVIKTFCVCVHAISPDLNSILLTPSQIRIKCGETKSPISLLKGFHFKYNSSKRCSSARAI